MGSVYRYRFSASIPSEEIEATLLLALLGTESLHGASLTRLDASHFFDVERGVCVVDGTTEAGQHLNRLFTGYLSREFGPDQFTVQRLEQVSATTGAPEEISNVRNA